MPGQDHGNEDDDGEDHDPDGHAGRRCQSFYLCTQVIGAEGIDSDPRNGAGDVCNPEIAPGHVIGASQEADNAAKQRDEAGKEDHFAAVAQEKILPDFDPRLAQMNVVAISQQQPVSELSAHPERDEISDDPTEDARDKD